MKKLILLLFVATLLAGCQPTTAPPPTAAPLTEPPPSPQEVVNSWLEAVNQGDIDTALSYLAEDAAVTISPAGPEGDAVFTSHTEIRRWYETMTAAKGITTLSDCKVDGESMSCLDTYADEGLKSMGVDFIVGEWAATFEDGKIQSYTFSANPESLAKLAPPAEPKPEPTKELVIVNLPGTYKAMIGPEGAAYGIETGSYLLRLRDDLRWFVVDPKDDFIYVQGYYTYTADQIVIKGTGGPMIGSCSAIENTYGWTAEGAALTFTPIRVDAKCEGEKFFFTSNPLALQP